MARQNQSEETRSGNRNQTSSSQRPETSGVSPDRERNIERSLDRPGQRSTSVNRPVSGTIQGTTSPFALMRRMSRDMDRILDHFGFGRFGTGLQPPWSAFDDDLWSLTSPAQDAAWLPQVEMFNRGDKVIVRADLPGLSKDDVNVEINDGVLTISGERKDEHEEDRDGYYRSERSYGKFFRSLQLPEDVNDEQCAATFKDGVLELEFKAPKQERRIGKKIPIR